MNYELSGSDLNFNYKTINNELKLNKKLGIWMNIQMNGLHGISIPNTKNNVNNPLVFIFLVFMF
jgi:hypothetical protein